MTQRQKVWWSVARSDFAGGLCIESRSLCVHVNPTLTLPNLGEGILISPPRPGEIQRGLISVLCAKARHRLPDQLFATPSCITYDQTKKGKLTVTVRAFIHVGDVELFFLGGMASGAARVHGFFQTDGAAR